MVSVFQRRQILLWTQIIYNLVDTYYFCFTRSGTETYDLESCLGKGTYGTVFRAMNPQTGETVALKTQKPAWVWEFYITREIKSRLTNPHMVHYYVLLLSYNESFIAARRLLY